MPVLSSHLFSSGDQQCKLITKNGKILNRKFILNMMGVWIPVLAFQGLYSILLASATLLSFADQFVDCTSLLNADLC